MASGMSGTGAGPREKRVEERNLNEVCREELAVSVSREVAMKEEAKRLIGIRAAPMKYLGFTHNATNIALVNILECMIPLKGCQSVYVSFKRSFYS